MCRDGCYMVKTNGVWTCKKCPHRQRTRRR